MMVKQTKKQTKGNSQKIVNHGVHFPTAYTILILLIILVAGLTYIMPTGSYNYETSDGVVISASEVAGYSDGDLTPIPNTYTSLDKNPQGFFAIILAPIKGFYNSIDVILFVLIIGGFLGVVMSTGAINSWIARITKKLKGRELAMIPILMLVFAIGGTTYGMGEECVAFYLLIIPMVLAVGYDALVGAAIILLGSGVGVLASTVNPFATGIASGFAGVELGAGMGLRLAMLITLWIVCVLFVMRYARRVRADPKKSLLYSVRKENRDYFLHTKEEAFPEFTRKRKIILWIFALTFLVMIYSVIPWSDFGIMAIPTLGWWFGELTGLFLVSAILIGIVDGMAEKSLAASFVQGAKDLLGVAIIIGIARGISVIMSSGLIADTLLMWAEKAVTGLSSVFLINGIYWIEVFLSFFIPSSSGLAVFSMPILAPVAGFAGVAQSLVVTAFQSANGLVNLIAPTSVILMGGLAMARIPYDKWIKFVAPLLLMLAILTMVFLTAGLYF